ncbi:hypothetical protein Tco_0313403 [Tanacetum coccineum]
MILPVGYFLRAVINARLLLYFLLELSVFVLFHALFYRRLGKWYTRGVIQVSVGVTIPSVSLSVPLYNWGRVGEGLRITSHCSSRSKASDMGLLDYIRTADPRKVQAVEVQKGEEQVTLFDSIKHCFVSWIHHAAAHYKQRSLGSGAGAEVSVSSAKGNVVEEDVIPEGAFLDLTDPECDVTVVEKDVAQKQPEKAKRKKLWSHSLSERTLPEGPIYWGILFQRSNIPMLPMQRFTAVADAPVYTAADIVTSNRGKTLVVPTPDVGGSSQPEMSEESTDSFYETTVLNSEDAKRWYIPRWNITNDSLLDDGFSCRTRCLVGEVMSRTEHELELKEKLRGDETSPAEGLRLVISGLLSFYLLGFSFLHISKLPLTTPQKLLVVKARNLFPPCLREKMDLPRVNGCVRRLEGEFYPAYLTVLAGRRWVLTQGMELAMVKCLKSPKYQGFMGHALGRAVDYGMQEGLAARHEHGIAVTPLLPSVAYNPKTTGTML